MYLIALLQDDEAAMEQQAAWCMGKPGVEDELLSLKADTAVISAGLRAHESSHAGRWTPLNELERRERSQRIQPFPL